MQGKKFLTEDNENLSFQLNTFFYIICTHNNVDIFSVFM